MLSVLVFVEGLPGGKDHLALVAVERLRLFMDAFDVVAEREAVTELEVTLLADVTLLQVLALVVDQEAALARERFGALLAFQSPGMNSLQMALQGQCTRKDLVALGAAVAANIGL